MDLPECPPSFKQIQHYLRIAQEHDSRDIVVAYWSRIYAVQKALEVMKGHLEETNFLSAVMCWLEKTKKEEVNNEAIMNEVVAKAHLENYALKLFLYADQQDRKSNFHKNVVKTFFSSGLIYDIIETFGEPCEESTLNCKYAKWKAAYIHNCIKNGEMPLPGPIPEGGVNAGINRNSFEITAVISDLSWDSAAESVKEHETLPHQSPSSTTVELLEIPSLLFPQRAEEMPECVKPSVGAAYATSAPISDLELSPEQILKAQRYARFAESALNFDDVETAICNIEKSLKLLTTGKDD